MKKNECNMIIVKIVTKSWSKSIQGNERGDFIFSMGKYELDCERAGIPTLCYSNRYALIIAGVKVLLCLEHAIPMWSLRWHSHPCLLKIRRRRYSPALYDFDIS
jgi:hypothetical protein